MAFFAAFREISRTLGVGTTHGALNLRNTAPPTAFWAPGSRLRAPGGRLSRSAVILDTRLTAGCRELRKKAPGRNMGELMRQTPTWVKVVVWVTVAGLVLTMVASLASIGF